MKAPGCPLCDGPGGTLVFTSDKFRVIRCDEPGIAAFYRVVWSEHVPEFSQLPADDRRLCMDAVVCVEECLRQHLAPDKINLAALGNAVPHLHWHVIARFRWDSYFPGSVWSAAQRNASPQQLAEVVSKLTELELDLCARLSARSGNCSSM
ncbi:HIT family protein [Caenimonas sp. SL110]|uniref:HIT family protein n=1 Tax=Caenimonas sp. SL110 TaxID=1450524 RepID=UPI00065348AC|nr:HIT family protein [Caenimonas sp. SL110]